MTTWIVGLIAACVSLLGVWWQVGGHLSARRRRLQQELEILERLPEGTSVRADMAVHTMKSARRYLWWSRRPLWRRLVGGTAFSAAVTIWAISAVVFVTHWVEGSEIRPPIENPFPMDIYWTSAVYIGVVLVLATIGVAIDPSIIGKPPWSRSDRESAQDLLDHDVVRRLLGDPTLVSQTPDDQVRVEQGPMSPLTYPHRFRGPQGDNPPQHPQ